LTNNSAPPLTISSLVITPSNLFKITGTTCGTTLAGGRTCDITVTFSPTGFDISLATLAVTDNATNSPQTAILLGLGI